MKIHIFAMRTWGELGNLLAAKTLASCLRESETRDLEVEVFETENFIPRFEAYGGEIAAIIKDKSLTVPERIAAYHNLMERIGQVFYSGFETAEHLREPLAGEIAPLVDHLSTHRPDLVIGTKGVISRTLMAAMARSIHRPPLLNFVTNEGLLSLALHRSRAIKHHFVPFESGRQSLIMRHGYSPEQVRCVGRLIAHAHVSSVSQMEEASVLPGALLRADPSEARLLVFSNRGGRPYLDLLRTIGESGGSPSVLFIGYNDPELVREARRLKEELGATQWHIVEKLGQGDYIKSVRWLARGRYPLLISKTGPNTMLEATYFGIPQLLLGSGLPAEEWVEPFVEEHGFGRAFRDVGQLCGVLGQWLRQPEEIEGRRRVAEDFSRRLMNQEVVAMTLQRCVSALAVPAEVLG